MAALRAGCLAALLAGCLGSPTTVVRLPTREPVAVVYVLEHEQHPELLPVPDRFAAAVGEEVDRRNLEGRRLAEGEFVREFQVRRTTRDRLAWAAGKAGAPYLLLVEARAAYYAQIEGRFRWTVTVRATVTKARGEPLSSDFEVPIVLQFHHEREREALAEAAPVIAPRVGELLDRFLGGLGTPPTAASATPAARPEPGKGDAIYFVLVDRFEDGDPTNDAGIDRADPQGWYGGDLAGIRKRLDWLEALGVGTIWLSPVFAARTEKFEGHGAFHGYWTRDLGRVEPRFGDEAELRALADDLHRRGMHLILDLVVNHVAWDAPIRRAHPEWFHPPSAISDWSDERQLTRGQVHGLPDLAQEKPEVSRWLLGHATRWLERVRPDGFRLDAVKHVPLGFWARFNTALRARGGDGFLLLGELLDGDPARLATTLREGGFGALFDFPLAFALVDVFCKDQPVGRLAATLSLDRLHDDPQRMVTLLDNHDLPRVASLCGGDLGRVEQALTAQLTARGIPSLTYGTEVGLTGDQEPDNRGPMRFRSDHPLRRVIASLLWARRAHPALRGGSDRILAFDAEAGLFAYARLVPEEAVVIAINRGRTAVTVDLPPALQAADRRDLSTGAPIDRLEVAPGTIRLVLLTPTQPFTIIPPLERRVVELAVAGPAEVRVVGAGPELGGWDPGRGLPAVDGRVRLALQAGRVYELKLVAGGLWQEGPNRYLYVPPGGGVFRACVAWEGGCRR